MHVDLVTLYLLAIGTLLASAGMMFWEYRTHPTRSRELRLLATGFTILAIGCSAVLFRRDLPGVLGSALSNLLILSGYLMVLAGVAALSGRQYRVGSIALLAVMAGIWAIWGSQWLDVIWAHVSAFPIGLVAALTAWEMFRCTTMRSRARNIVVAVAGIHAVLYVARALVLPWLVAENGSAIQSLASKITIYEGVLYSVILPMTLLKLIRDETHGQLLRESQTDYLTRLGNRRWFFEQGAREIDGARGRAPVAVLAFDLDHFKSINDQHGHQRGDEVLKSFAEIARGVMGQDALIARIGGEEFAALLSGEPAQRAPLLGQAVATRFAEAASHRHASAGIPATVSVGLAQYGSEVPTLSEGLAAADRALYRAKSLGGNRLELAPAAA
ncbi:GGDEF domain-containing protein [Cupriavidus agavae]|uniref:diguanylate cyclase n=1 Tax=Cupriavidus agavae TaxID=1001822 RepID=A0A4Q7RC79_9BURK|nr:GGDEF domain-containing protein [Cupriavidus agavae]RZT30775.1 diguanylate cyclase (GGDEF)-like protein [Cupriavidus agavae]